MHKAKLRAPLPERAEAYGPVVFMGMVERGGNKCSQFSQLEILKRPD